MLLLPVDAQFAVSTRRFGMDNLVNALVGIAIVTFSLSKLGITPAPNQIGFYVIGVCLGVTIHYSIMFTLATMSFWIVRAQGLIYGYFNLFNIGRYPDVVFHGTFKFIFSYLIPVIIVANLPVRALTRALENPFNGFLHLAGVSALVLFASRLFWRFALRRYSSASS
jgi:ABC-2 type transport system permease protein